MGTALLTSELPERAEVAFREALAIREATLPAGHVKIAEARTGVGTALAMMGRGAPPTLLGEALEVYDGWGTSVRGRL